MCDCYDTKCSGRGCKIWIPIHITDFCLPRDSFKAYCEKHIPKKGGIIYHGLVNDKDSDFKRKMIFGIVYNKDVKFPARCCHHTRKDKCEHPAEEAVTINDSGIWATVASYR